MKRRFALLIALVFVFAGFASTASAAMISPTVFYQTEQATVLEGVRKDTYQNGLGQTVVQYSGLDSYIDSALAEKGGSTASLEVAKKIIKEIEGTDILSSLPEEYLMEALTYQEATQSISYIKASPDGTLQYVSEKEMIAEIGEKLDREQLLASADDGSFEGEWTSDDGYMKLVTTAVRVESPETSVDDRNHYYIVSAASYWLIEPTYTYEDVLALSFGSAIYDDSYTDFARIYELTLCKFCSNFSEMLYDETYTANGYEYNDPEGSEHLNIIYPSGGAGIACRVNFVKFTEDCYHNGYDLSYIDMMFSYVRSRVYSQGDDFTISSAYSHKWIGLGSIDVSISVGKGSLGGSIGFSGQTVHTDYWGRPVTVAYNSAIG